MTTPSHRHIASIRRRRATLKKRQTEIDVALELLRIECPHPAVTKTYGASTGNYDPANDGYWIDWHCPDCGKRWTTDQ